VETLPRGRHNLAREVVRTHQRERLVAAVVEEIHARGYARTTAAHVTARAHVSKSELYSLFPSKRECFLAAYEDGVDRLREEILDAVGAAPGHWGLQVCGALRALLAFLAANPARASMLLFEGLCLGPDAQQRFANAMRDLVPCLRQGWQVAGKGDPPPSEAVDEAVLGGTVSLLARRVQEGETDGLEELFPEIAEFALTPYVGTLEARRIISAS